MEAAPEPVEVAKTTPGSSKLRFGQSLSVQHRRPQICRKLECPWARAPLRRGSGPHCRQSSKVWAAARSGNGAGLLELAPFPLRDLKSPTFGQAGSLAICLCLQLNGLPGLLLTQLRKIRLCSLQVFWDRYGFLRNRRVLQNLDTNVSRSPVCAELFQLQKEKEKRAAKV